VRGARCGFGSLMRRQCTPGMRLENGPTGAESSARQTASSASGGGACGWGGRRPRAQTRQGKDDAAARQAGAGVVPARSAPADSGRLRRANRRGTATAHLIFCATPLAAAPVHRKLHDPMPQAHASPISVLLLFVVLRTPAHRKPRFEPATLPNCASDSIGTGAITICKPAADAAPSALCGSDCEPR
jgi:hypothetical protein